LGRFSPEDVRASAQIAFARRFGPLSFSPLADFSTLVMTAKMEDKKILTKLREICLSLPKTSETTTFGHPTFQVGTKTFTVLETYKGTLSISVKVGKKMQPVFLEDMRFYRTPYVGQHGWVSLRADTKLDWNEIDELVRGSYELVHNKKRRR